MYLQVVQVARIEARGWSQFYPPPIIITMIILIMITIMIIMIIIIITIILTLPSSSASWNISWPPPHNVSWSGRKYLVRII